MLYKVKNLGGLFDVSSNIDSLRNMITKLRSTLNELSISLLEDDKNRSSKIIKISEEMDILINEYILSASKNNEIKKE